MLPSPLQEIWDERLGGVRLWLKRDDLIDPELPGNKWRKLAYNLPAAGRTVLTFGGAYSNHIRAVAAAGRRFGFGTIGVIRGEERLPLNPSLAFAVARGMRLTYLDRTTYRRKHEPDVTAALRERFGDFHLIPEGGANAAGVRGCAELPAEIDVDHDVVCCPCGTGATLAGIATGLAPGRRAVGYAVLKGASFLDEEVRRWTDARDWRVELDFHFGGFARTPPELAAFADDFTERHGVELERVYVAKMLYGIYARPPGKRVVAVITDRPFP